MFFSITVGMEMKTGSRCCKNMAEDKDLNVMRYPRNRSQIVQHREGECSESKADKIKLGN